MKHIRHWKLPDRECFDHFDAPTGFGESYFWYCVCCRNTYATASLQAEDGNFRPWRGLGGICLGCPQHAFLIRGGIDSVFTRIMKDIPEQVISYMLEREIDFLGHQEHPHNKEN